LEKIEDNLDDLQVALWKGKSRRELTKRLCEEWGEVCPARKPEKKLVREVDEEFKAKTEKDVEMDELMAKMAGIPGMGGVCDACVCVEVVQGRKCLIETTWQVWVAVSCDSNCEL